MLYSSDENLKLQANLLLYNGELFTGTILTILQADTIYSASYRVGKKQGSEKKFYTERKIKEQRFYKSGKKEGKHFGFYENGNKKFEYNYVDDMFEGDFKEWYADTKPYQLKHYIAGKEEGMQQTWNADGSFYANYIMTDGRKYGLTGTKHCINIADSIAKEN